MADDALPDRAALAAFLRDHPGAGRMEAIRHFDIAHHQRPALRALFAALIADGALPAPPPRPPRTDLPETLPVEVTGTDADGDPIARPLGWRAADGPAPTIWMLPEAAGQPALAPGERVLARLKRLGAGRYEGRTLQRIGSAPPARILGVYEDGRIRPADRRQRADWLVPPGDSAGAQPGEIVLAAPLPTVRSLGPKPARVLERLGRADGARAASLLALRAHDIPDAFPAAALKEADAAGAPDPTGRVDLRALPLVTIDGADARDFDDAVWAEPQGDGWRAVVAIADVAHYVPEDSALDAEAARRGNSVYFPGRVVPMLPEPLSAGWCSLLPGEDRACLFLDMAFDAEGRRTALRIGRGLMSSAARLTYDALEAGADPVGTRAALYGLLGALRAARARRGALDLDVPEREVRLDADGQVAAIGLRTRFDAHRVIEELMVAANRAAAEALARRGLPCLYRIHDRPAPAQIEALRPVLASIGAPLPPQVRPRDLARALARVEGTPAADAVREAMLRAQAQAAYAPRNIGHFGLALPRYLHVTSPIRRYADLVAHRALLAMLGLGVAPDAAGLDVLGVRVTATERRAAAAERDAVDRLAAAWMSQRIGHAFSARISGVTRHGLFVTLDATGVGGIVPLASLPDDRWSVERARPGLAGRRTGLTFSLGQPVDALLARADPLTGSLVFHLLQGAR